MSKFLKAAELIEYNGAAGCCIAISRASKDEDSLKRSTRLARSKFEKLFKPTDKEYRRFDRSWEFTDGIPSFWMGPRWKRGSINERTKNDRIIAMLLMHEMFGKSKKRKK